jgi:hypothetical protein
LLEQISMAIQRSERHQKIIGQFGEHLVCNRLSCSGFDVMLVDHVGIDVIAIRKGIGRLGISVKSRTRARKDTEEESVNLFRATENKLERVCKRLKLTPWIAVYAETERYGDLYLTSLKNYREKYARDTKVLVWEMRKTHKEAYGRDVEVMHYHVEFTLSNWFKDVQGVHDFG